MTPSAKKKEKKAPTLSLKVAEAASKDVGRGLARFDPKLFDPLGVKVGDVVWVRGKRATPAKVMPTYVEDRGTDMIRIDGILRGNAGAGIDEHVQIEKADAAPARKIVLAPLTEMRGLRGKRDMRYIGTLLESLPLTAGDSVRATMFGSRTQDFEVVTTVPKGAVLIQSTTTIEMRGEAKAGEPAARARVTYEDIGGLARETQRVREMIELPLKYPEVFERLGIEPPKGVFLHGPPGCGKTLIARAVANETDAYFTHLSGPEIMHKYYGESEAHLRQIFEDASAHAPAIVFLDEIDAIAPKRAELGGEKQLEKRVVSQLLALMDGLKSRGQIIVIGATNLPNLVDPALRRPGRFDRELEIGIPDRNGRADILQIHTRGMPLAEDVDLDKIAEITHGYVGADLEALGREAAMAALRGIFPDIDFELKEIPYETLETLEVTMDNFREALCEVEPSVMREVFVEVPNVGWADVGGLQEVKQSLREAVEWPLKHRKLFEHAKTRPAKGILMHGAPGTGKTLAAKALAKESSLNFIPVKGPELMSKWVGESERGVREVFHKAKQAAPCIVFFDEIDALVPRRGTAQGAADRVISQFLSEMDGIEELKDVIVLAATNRMDMLDPALLREGRFDLIIELPFPDEDAKLEIFKVHMRGKPLADDVDLKRIAKACGHASGARIAAICRCAALNAIRRFIHLAEKKELPLSKMALTAADMDAAVREVIGESAEPPAKGDAP